MLYLYHLVNRQRQIVAKVYCLSIKQNSDKSYHRQYMYKTVK